ncbi:hypothetical protein J6590_105963 [Homalodisca vitripennis]|nr:hypothetical protein J6590_105963 [Homalodisca vitripennis]
MWPQPCYRDHRGVNRQFTRKSRISLRAGRLVNGCDGVANLPCSRIVHIGLARGKSRTE